MRVAMRAHSIAVCAPTNVVCLKNPKHGANLNEMHKEIKNSTLAHTWRACNHMAGGTSLPKRQCKYANKEPTEDVDASNYANEKSAV